MQRHKHAFSKYKLTINKHIALVLWNSSDYACLR